MASMLRVKVRWSGFTGSPGYSVFHFRDFAAGEPTAADAASAVDRVEQFFADVTTLLPSATNTQALSDVEVIEDTTGQLVTILNGAAGPARNGGAVAGATWSTALGAVCTWRTGGIRNGRRVKGRTFLVPLAHTSFATNGTLTDAAITTMTTACTTLTNPAGTPDLGVYSRPTALAPASGAWHAVTSFTIPDMGAVLRSRRD